MRYPAQVVYADNRGDKLEWGRPFYLSQNELEKYKGESFASIWQRSDLTVPKDILGPIGLEISDPWGHVLFELAQPIDP